MNNIEKKLDALIDALGFDVEEVVSTFKPPFSILKAALTNRYDQQGEIKTTNYKLTKRENKLCMTLSEYEKHMVDNTPIDFFKDGDE